MPLIISRMGYSIENGINWLLGGNDLDICYTEKQNDGDYENPICWDLTGANYKEMILTQEFLSVAILVVGVFVFILFLRAKRKKLSED